MYAANANMTAIGIDVVYHVNSGLANFDYYNYTFDVIDTILNQHNNRELVNHQHTSYKQFIEKDIGDIIKQFNTRKIFMQYDPNANKHRLELHIEFLNYNLGRPTIHENDGSFIVYSWIGESRLENSFDIDELIKLLEDTPKNTYVFLITTNAAAILPTIRSRCRKITYNYNSAVLGNFGSKQVDDYYVRPFLKMTKIDEHLSYIKDFSTKDRELWVEFTSNAQNLIARICKNLSGHDVALSPLEKKFLEQKRVFEILKKQDE